VKIGDLVVYNPASVGGMTGEIVRCEDFGLGIILDENPHYYFINWSNICTDSPSLATIKDHVVQATIKNVQRLREHNERKKNT